MGCGSLLLSHFPNCALPFQGGVGNDSRLVLIEKADILSYTSTSLDVLSAITLVTNKSAWGFGGFKQSLKPSYKRIPAPSSQSMYEHSAEYFVYDYSQVMKNNLQRKANGRYVAIFENSLQDANTFEVMGIGIGLELLDLGRAPGEDGGAFKIKLKTPDGEFEGKMPQTLFSTDYATTKGLIDALLFLPTITAGGLSIVTYVAATPTAITITGTNFFGGGTNNAVTRVELVNQANGAIVPFIAAIGAVTNTTIAHTTPATVAGVYKVRVYTIKGVTELSTQNIVTT